MIDQQLIWARCHSIHDMRAIAALDAQLREDGDPFTIMPTLVNGPAGVVAPPVGRRQVQTFLGLYEPALALWVGGKIDSTTLQICERANIGSIALNSGADMFENLPRTWLPARRRALFTTIRNVLAIDEAAKRAAIRAGAKPSRIEVTGTLSETARILPYDEDDRADFAASLGARPVWLAAAVTPEGAPCVLQAHKEASRRAHRLLLVISPNATDDIAAINQLFLANGFRTALRSETLVPSDETQVYIADTVDELGLWHRVSSISYIDGTFDEGARTDPFAAAALGSVVVHGPDGGNWHDQLQILDSAGASMKVAAQEDLGKTINSLLSADKAASLAHAGWDVTTRGAMVLETLVRIVRETLEQKAS